MKNILEKIQPMLTEGEEVQNQADIHWVVFGWPVLLLIVAFLSGVLFHPLMGIVVLILALYPTYNAYIHYKLTDLILTNKKVMSRSGFLSRDWIRMDFDRIENAYLEEPIVGRILGYSTVVVSGVGSGEVAVTQVQNGNKFVNDLETLLAEHKTTVKTV